PYTTLCRSLVSLVISRTSEEVDGCWEDRRSVLRREAGNRLGRRGSLGSQVVDQLVRGPVNRLGFIGCQVVTPLILLRIIECRKHHVLIDVEQGPGLQE